VYSEHK